jgi:predicted lipopolysaccharide heptosyltransferase III
MASAPPNPRPFLAELPAGARLLLVRLRSLGDAVLLTPALAALKQWRPDLRLTVLLYRRFAGILEGHPHVDEIFAFEPAGLTAPLEIGRTVSAVRARRFDACLNLHGGTLSALVTLASGARQRAGFGHFRFRFAYTALAPEPLRLAGGQRLHAVERVFALLYSFGLPPGEIPPARLVVSPAARSAVAQKLAARGLRAGGRYAVCHPAANFFTKEWPFERWAQFARGLESEHGLATVFTGGPGEGAKLDAVARAAGKTLVRLEALPLPELAALVEGAALFVGNDSGPAHVAAALGRPTVVLFGSSDAVAWGPWSANSAIVQNHFDCNPCRGDRCYAFAEPRCILSITLEQARAAVTRLLAAPRPGVSLPLHSTAR